jgi:hypothetical protein
LIDKAASFLTFPISIIHPGFKTEARVKERNVIYLRLVMYETQGERLKRQIPTRDVEIGHEAGAVFGIPLIFYPLLFSWPGLPYGYRLKAAALALPALLILIPIDISLAFLIEIEKRFMEPTFKSTLVYYVAQGFSFGGRQFLGILLFAAALAPRFLKKPVYVDAQPLERNDLCPCGSGKKYKNCCMR